jgi:hypothetical protein|tara:strand:- start:388 stop:2448 length:2061 start_codon:yes stop_codon:yes gene_type:complete
MANSKRPQLAAADNLPLSYGINMKVICTPHLWIPMPDGKRLGARVWLPEGCGSVPAILEYIPYRKDDYSALRDSATVAYFATQGYACIRVDMRGSGSSDGVLYDEYTDQEIDDGVAVIEWLVEQSWCNGKIGTIGISWGGIIGLLLAQRAPEALKTVIVLGATESRYYDDAGYYMGCMVGQTIGWAAMMFGYNTRPPDPELAGKGWRDLWFERLENAPHYLEHWLSHQHEDDYWLTNTVRTNYDAIKIPVYAVSGHADCWPNTVSRLLENLSVPVRGLQGAWSHRYPHLGIPGPTLNFLPDASRWFDQWLKNIDTGIMDEATYQVYLQESVRPQTYYDKRPGRWVGEDHWPSQQIENKQYHLSDNGLSTTPSEACRFEVQSPQTVGFSSGEYMPWFSFGPADELPADQQSEDAGSLAFDTQILDSNIEILGNAIAKLTITSDQPQALIALRLCDVWPDGSSTLITRGILNLSQRNGKSVPESLIPGQEYLVEVSLNHVGYIVPVGHQLRLAISTSYWPMAWPSPTKTKLGIRSKSSLVNIPTRKSSAKNAQLTEFGETKMGEPLATTTLREVRQTRSQIRDKSKAVTTLEIFADNGKSRFDQSQMEMGSTFLQRFSITDDNPLSARAEYESNWEHGRGNWQITTKTTTVLTCDQEYFYLQAQSKACEGGREVFKKKWNKKYLRDHF